MMIITDLKSIREAQTVKAPGHDNVRLALPQYIRGWVTAVYNHQIEKWMYSYCETEKEAVDHYETLKKICQVSGGAMNWLLMSEMYKYHSSSETKAHWSLYGIVVEE